MTAANATEAASVTDWPRFPNAPIVEAVLDIQVRFTHPPDGPRLAAFHEHIRDRYPDVAPHITWEFDFQIVEGGPRQGLRPGPPGFIFKSPTGQRMAQVRQNGFTLNWLKPYEAWPAFRDEARPLWELYVTVFQPDAVGRLGLRYVNRIELPLPFSDFRDYVKMAPEIAPGLPQGLSNFFMRLEIPDPARGLTAIVTETIQPVLGLKGQPQRVPLIFDIDIVSGERLAPSGPEVWDTLERMRQYKNEVFFSSMTERARELFR
jgi:uncharacterized protein (TIGR04255 family)